MPVVSVTVKLDGAVELEASLKRVSRTISTKLSSSVGRRLGIEGLRIVRKLTPRQSSRRSRTGSTSRGHEPFWKQWELIEQVALSTAYRAVIRNKATSGGMKSPGFRALAALEFGAAPHTFTSRVPHGPGRYPLRWRQGGAISVFAGRTLLEFGSSVEEFRIGQRRRPGEALAWVVNHPGNAPFHMVRDTKVQMQRVAARLLKDFQKEIERTFGPLNVSVS